MLLRAPSEKVVDQSICRTKEHKARLQFLASAMPKSVMPSGAENGEVSQAKKRKNLAVLAETFFSCKVYVMTKNKTFPLNHSLACASYASYLAIHTCIYVKKAEKVGKIMTRRVASKQSKQDP